MEQARVEDAEVANALRRLTLHRPLVLDREDVRVVSQYVGGRSGFTVSLARGCLEPTFPTPENRKLAADWSCEVVTLVQDLNRKLHRLWFAEDSDIDVFCLMARRYITTWHPFLVNKFGGVDKFELLVGKESVFLTIWAETSSDYEDRLVAVLAALAGLRVASRHMVVGLQEVEAADVKGALARSEAPKGVRVLGAGANPVLVLSSGKESYEVVEVTVECADGFDEITSFKHARTGHVLYNVTAGSRLSNATWNTEERIGAIFGESPNLVVQAAEHAVQWVARLLGYRWKESVGDSMFYRELIQRFFGSNWTLLGTSKREEYPVPEKKEWSQWLHHFCARGPDFLVGKLPPPQ